MKIGIQISLWKVVFPHMGIFVLLLVFKLQTWRWFEMRIPSDIFRSISAKTLWLLKSNFKVWKCWVESMHTLAECYGVQHGEEQQSVDRRQNKIVRRHFQRLCAYLDVRILPSECSAWNMWLPEMLRLRRQTSLVRFMWDSKPFLAASSEGKLLPLNVPTDLWPCLITVLPQCAHCIL